MESLESSETLPLKPLNEEDEGRGDEAIESRQGIKLTIFNLLSACIGVGAIGISYGISTAGLGISLVFMVIFTILTAYTLRILIKSAQITGAYNYQELAYVLFGNPGFALVSITLFAEAGFATISHNISIADNLIQLLKLTDNDIIGYIKPRPVILLITTSVITLPLSMYRHVGDIAKYGVLCLGSAAVLIIAIAVAAPSYMQAVPSHKDDWLLVKPTFGPLISLYLHAIVCHQIALPIYRSLKNGNNKRWAIVTRTVCIIAFCVYGLIGFGGFISFRSFTQGNILENYCIFKVTSIIARVAFTSVLLLTVHVEIFVCREVVNTAIFPNFRKNKLDRHIAVTMISIYGVYGLSLITSCLDIPLMINGTLAIIPLGYIFPVIMYLKSAGPVLSTCEKLWNIFLVALFAVVMVLEVNAIIQRLLSTGLECDHTVAKFYCNVTKT